MGTKLNKNGEKVAILESAKEEEASETTEGRISWRMELIGFSIGVIGVMFDATSSTCVRFLQEAIPDLQKNGFRFTALLLLVTPYFAWRRRFPGVKDCGRWLWVTSWSLVGAFGVLTFFASFVFINLGYIAVTYRLTFILFTMLTSVTCSKVKLLKVEVVGVILSVVGAILIFQRYIFHNHQTNYHNSQTLCDGFNISAVGSDLKEWSSINRNDTGYHHVCLGRNHGKERSHYIPPPYNLTEHQALFVGLTLTTVSALCEVVHIALQKIKLQESDIMDLCFWYSVIGMTSSFLLSAIFETMTTPHTTRDWLLLIGHCFCSASYALIITTAQKIASIITVSSAVGTKLVFYFLSTYFIFRDISNGIGRYIEVCGFLVTLVATFMPSVYELIAKNPFKKE